MAHTKEYIIIIIIILTRKTTRVSTAGWFHAVRGMESIGIIGVIVSCIYALATNCCRAFPGPRTRFLEIFAGITGMYPSRLLRTDAGTTGVGCSGDICWIYRCEMLYTSVDIYRY